MLESLPDGWMRFDGGRRWRCRTPGYLCEVDDPGGVPSLLHEHGVADKLRRIRALYAGRLQMGALDRDGTALDILTANAMTESYGTVPSPLNTGSLDEALDRHPELPLDLRLDTLLRQFGAQGEARWLVRMEPGYVNPVSTPARVSVGAHHMLISTANMLPSQRHAGSGPAAVRNQVVQLAANSLHAATLAIEYLNGQFGRHQGQLPLIAATYNAGSVRSTTANPWHLLQYGAHLDRWIGYYNASRASVAAPQITASPSLSPPLAMPLAAATALPAGSPVLPGNEAQLTAHFSLAEFTASSRARELGIANQPSPAVVERLRRVADRIEAVRTLLGNRSIQINSGYRCLELNRALGSKDNSMHPQGLAVDFVCPGFGSPLDICRAVAASRIGFDQMIHEFGRWVHLGLSLEGTAERRQQLTIDHGGTHVGLLPV